MRLWAAMFHDHLGKRVEGPGWSQSDEEDGSGTRPLVGVFSVNIGRG